MAGLVNRLLFPTLYWTRSTIDRLQALFESGVFSQEDHTVVGVLFEHGLIWSNYMTVVGLLKYDSDHFVQVSAPTRYRTKWNQVRLMRSASAVWPDALGAVDPHSMQVRTSEPGLEHIRERLLGLSEVLSLMQFCVSVLSQHDGTITAQVSRPGGAMLSFAPDSAYIPPHTFSDALLGTPAFQLFKWAFRGEDYDKIDLVRDLIDREVRGRDDDPVTHLLLCAPELLTSARAGYKALRVRALESYWKARQEAKEKVDAFVATTRSNVDKLRADMLGRVIQFFTAIVAFLAVGVLQPKLSSWIKSSGLIFSIIYILLIGGFQLLPAWLDYKQLLFEARDAVDAYNVLSPNERENLKSRLRNGWQSDFVKWLTACVAVYAAAAVTFTVLLVALLTSY